MTNVAPVATITPANYSATEQTVLDLKNNGMSVGDADGGSGIETVTLSVGEGSLAVTPGASGATVSDSGTASVTITGTVAQIDALLNTDASSTVSYIDNTDIPSASTELTLTIHDNGNTGGGDLSSSATSTINITAVNDVPVATITPASYSGIPNIAINLKNNGLSVSDVDSNGGSETVTLSVTSGTLTVAPGTSGAGVGGSGTNSVTITGTIAEINALLNTDASSSVSFADSSSGAKTLMLAIDDNGHSGGAAQTAQDTAQITLDQPAVVDLNGAAAGSGVTLAYTEDQGQKLIAPAGTVSDSDSANFNGGWLRIHVAASNTSDSLYLLTDATVAVSQSGTVSVGGHAIGTAPGLNTITNGVNGSDLVINFNTADATPAAVTTLLEHIAYLNNSFDPVASRTVTFTVDDGSGVTGSDVATVNITAVNNTPTATLPGVIVIPHGGPLYPYNAVAQTPLDLKNPGVSVSDIDSDGGSEIATLSVIEGTLTVTAGTSGATVSGSGTGSVTINGTIAQINALLNTDGSSTISYIDNSDNPASSTTLTLKIDDNGHTGTGGDLSSSATTPILITVPTTAVETSGSTSLVQTGHNFFLYANGTSNGPELKYGGSPFVAGAWAPIGAEQTSTGYEVALFNASSALYTVWNTDSSGNVLSTALSGVSGTSTALESIETSFAQDLNGDGVIGLPGASGTTIEAFGATRLLESGNHYFLNPVAGGIGPELTYGGTPYVAGAWAPIGAEKTSAGYEVALFNASSNLYVVWNTDSSGNVLSTALASVSGTSQALEAIETSFQQDLNGDHTIGIPATIIEAHGATALVQVGNDYFLNPVAGGTGPELTYGGTPYVAGAWAPIGAEHTSTGYELALFNASSNLYTVWNTDSSGNVLSTALSGVSGTSTALESIEVSFQQDLNGDHTIGIPATTIEAHGATALVQVGNDYFLNPVAGGTGPELTYGGTPYVAGAWAPIGAEHTSTGYEVALFNASSNLYTVWNTDSSGNVLSTVLSGVSGTSAALESIETSFQQDLNGNNMIGSQLSGGISNTSTAGAVTVISAGSASFTVSFFDVNAANNFSVTIATTPIIAPSSGDAHLSSSAANDTFVFNAHFGNDTVAGFQPGLDQVDVDHSLFASISDLLAHTADNAGGSAVVTVAPDQSITFDGVSSLVLHQHAGDFHLI